MCDKELTLKKTIKLKNIQDKNSGALLHIFDWLILILLLFAADFQANPTDISCKINEKLANEKLCNTVLILDALFI